jgi:hypothetical protein
MICGKLHINILLTPSEDRRTFAIKDSSAFPVLRWALITSPAGLMTSAKSPWGQIHAACPCWTFPQPRWLRQCRDFSHELVLAYGVHSAQHAGVCEDQRCSLRWRISSSATLYGRLHFEGHSAAQVLRRFTQEIVRKLGGECRGWRGILASPVAFKRRESPRANPWTSLPLLCTRNAKVA